MAEFTLLELHLDGAEFTANAPFTSSDDDTESKSKSRWSRKSEPTSGTDDDPRGGRNVGRLALLALGVVAVLALLLRLYLGSGENGLDTDDLDDDL